MASPEPKPARGSRRSPATTPREKSDRKRASDGQGARTRGGWTPAGTGAERRAIHTERGTARGERTRAQIVAAARRVFERDGYLDVGVADIAKEAGVGHGSFYTYFSSKLEVFRVLAAEVAEAVDRSVPHRPAGERHLDAVDALSQANRRYIEVYRENARMYALLEQLGHMDDGLGQSSFSRRGEQIQRVGGLIRSWQTRGLADPAVDPTPTAAALISMISNYCYWLFVTSEGDEDVERATDAINQIWIRAVDLRRRPSRKWLADVAPADQPDST